MPRTKLAEGLESFNEIATIRIVYCNSTILGRVDGFDQDESGDEGDERREVPFGLFAA